MSAKPRDDGVRMTTLRQKLRATLAGQFLWTHLRMDMFDTESSARRVAEKAVELLGGAPVRELVQLATRPHVYNDEDPWYSCPKAPGGCADDRQPKDVCTCGADKHNARVDELARLLGVEAKAP
jgi:hypothetical protein